MSLAPPAITGVAADAATLTVNWSDDRQSTFLHLWLRDNCPQRRHASTGHRIDETSAIPDDVHPSALHVDAGGDVTITWAHDGHVSTFPAAWLRANDYSNGARHARPERVLWDASIGEALPEASWPALAVDDDVRRAFLRSFCAYGVGVLRDVPSIPGTVLDVAALLGEVRVTSWGRVFDVVSMEDANSVAYTNLPLVTHTDEGYRDPAPTVQLQHFLRADAAGGASTLVDGFAVAEELRATAPAQFDLLASTVLDFHFADATAELHASAPVLSVGPDGRLTAVRYSNHSALPFLLPPDRMGAYYAAYRAFGRLRESERFQLRLALGAGDLYIVDNHRVLHGRTGFSSGGARHLQSCYVERDELVSRLAVLERKMARSGFAPTE